jgi:hypothetical protein
MLDLGKGEEVEDDTSILIFGEARRARSNR